MNIKNTMVATSILVASAFTSSAFALIPSSPLYDLTPANAGQIQNEITAKEGVVLLFGSDNGPIVTIHDSLAGPGSAATENLSMSQD